MGILCWVVVGVGAGAAAKVVLRHPDSEALVVPLVVGSAGAVVGGFLASVAGLTAVTELSATSVAVALIGALAALAPYRVLAPRRSNLW